MPRRHGQWNELSLAARVPAGHQRDVASCCRTSAQRTAGPARRLLHPGATTRSGPTPTASPGCEALHDEEQVGPARRADADLVGDGVVRRLRAAHGARHRAARHAVLRDARRQLARLPPAGPRGSRWSALGQHGRRHPRGQPRRGVGGERVLVRAVLARSTPTVRWASASYFESPYRPGREDHGRRVLRLDVREPGAGAAREGRGRGADAAGATCAATASSRSPTTSTGWTSARSRDAELDGAEPDEPAVLRKPTTAGLDAAADRRGRARSACAGRRLARWPAGSRPSRKLELLLARDASTGAGRSTPRPATSRSHVSHARDRPGRRRVGAGADLPAADADPHPLRQREVPQRDRNTHPLWVNSADAARIGLAHRATWSG